MRTLTGCLVALVAITSMGCKSFTQKMDTRMITRNAYAESAGLAQMASDADECGSVAVNERRRLMAEMVGGDTYLEDQKQREATGSAVGRGIGEMSQKPVAGPGRNKANGEIDSEKVGGMVGAAAGGFIISALTADSSKHDQKMMAYDLDNVHTFIRFRNICLRTRGYEVSEYQEDGVRSPHFLHDPLRVVLRDGDGSEVVMYRQPEP